MTLLSCLRGIILEPVLNTSSITDPYTGTCTGFDPDEVKAVMDMMLAGKSILLDTEWKDFHFSGKSGPNGVAMKSAITELTSVLRSTDSLIGALAGVGLNSILQFFKGLIANDDSFQRVVSKSNKLVHLGRLACFGDKEGKTRVVALLDYWSQSALRPLHSSLMRVLKGLPTDCTFNQDNFLRILSLPGPYYSIDLTNVTDRMPL